MTDIIPVVVALVVAFLAYKTLMGVARLAVILGVIGVVGYLYSSGTFG